MKRTGGRDAVDRIYHYHFFSIRNALVYSYPRKQVAFAGNERTIAGAKPLKKPGNPSFANTLRIQSA